MSSILSTGYCWYSRSYGWLGHDLAASSAFVVGDGDVDGVSIGKKKLSRVDTTTRLLPPHRLWWTPRDAEVGWLR
jgi:hypothetical protein